MLRKGQIFSNGMKVVVHRHDIHQAVKFYPRLKKSIDEVILIVRLSDLLMILIMDSWRECYCLNQI